MAGRPKSLSPNMIAIASLKRKDPGFWARNQAGKNPLFPRANKLENMTLLELSRLQNSVQLAMHWKREEEILQLKARITEMVKGHGFKDVKDILR
jgi:hypothetical protein